MGDNPLPRSSATKRSMARSLRAGIDRSTRSLNTSAPAGTRNVALPFTVSLRSDAGTIADSLSRSAIDAPPMFSGAVPKVFANTTRTRVPAIDVLTIWRSVWLFGVTCGNASGAGGAAGLPAGAAAGAAGGGRTAGRATTAVVHVATQ